MKYVVSILFMLVLPVVAFGAAGTTVDPIPFGAEVFSVPSGNTLVFSGNVEKGKTYTLTVTRKGGRHIEKSGLYIMTQLGEKPVSLKSRLVEDSDKQFKVTRTFTATATGKIYYRSHIFSGKDFKSRFPTIKVWRAAHASKQITKGGQKVAQTSLTKKVYEAYLNTPKNIQVRVSIK